MREPPHDFGIAWPSLRRDHRFDEERPSSAAVAASRFLSRSQFTLRAVSDLGRADVRFTFEGGNPAASSKATDEQSWVSHYFIGNDPSKYAVDVPAFGRVRYRDLYPGVDVEFFEHEGTLEYELLCEAGRESVCDQPLYPDEITDHSRVFDSVSSGAATIDGFVAKFDLAVSRLVFSTYIAGAGSLDVTAISGSSGIDVVGSANGGIPLTHAAFDTTYGAGTFGSEGFRIQLNGNGTAVHYATYLGGTGPGSTVMLDTRVGESGEHAAR